MPDQFETMNLKSARNREVDLLRQHYRQHRESLGKLAADAPTEQLAREYTKLVAEIDSALRKLDELEGRAPSPEAHDLLHKKTEPGARPLVPPPAVMYDGGETDTRANTGRAILIVGVGLLVLGLIAWLMWRGSSARRDPAPVVENPVTTMPVVETQQPPPEPPSPIRIAPKSIDYGTIAKGTRAVRQFEVTNSGSEPMQISVSRSECRCLYYDYNDKIAPGKKETITVTIDGAKARGGDLQETIRVSPKGVDRTLGTFEVIARVE